MMKTQIRRGVFETNSSSMHSITIIKKKDTPLEIPKELLFRLSYFGWDYEWLEDVNSKASYLWTACQYSKKKHIYERKIRTHLEAKYGIECTFFDPQPGDMSWGIDHANELGNFVETLCDDLSMLDRYLFSELSRVETSNDNSGDDLQEVDHRKYVEFFKGN